MAKINDKLSDSNSKVSNFGRVEQYWLGKEVKGSRHTSAASTMMEYQDSLIEKYKLKGVEYGNWTTQDDRHDFLMALAKSLEILSGIVGYKNIGFNYRVGVAFGARGRGGGALAHWEPGTGMINMTKDRSVGSFSHEYGHAIDYVIGSTVDQSSKFYSLSGGHSTSSMLTENTGGQLRAYANMIVDAIKATKSYTRLDEAADYWHRRTEVFARGFEEFVGVYLAKKKIRNEWLAGSPTFYYRSPAYVTEAEFKPIYSLYLNFCKELAAVMNGKKKITATPYGFNKTKKKAVK